MLILAEATNWGLKSAVAERQARQEKEQNVSDYVSTYQMGKLPS